jgi:hypothetical protein
VAAEMVVNAFRHKELGVILGVHSWRKDDDFGTEEAVVAIKNGFGKQVEEVVEKELTSWRGKQVKRGRVLVGRDKEDSNALRVCRVFEIEVGSTLIVVEEMGEIEAVTSLSEDLNKFSGTFKVEIE